MTPLTRELALRIGLAARHLKLPPRILVAALQEAVGLPFTAEGFRNLECQGLRSACGLAVRRHGDDSLEMALRYLQGLCMPEVTDDQETGRDDFPMPPCRPDGLLWDIGVAVLSRDGQHIDGELPGIRHLRIYRLNPGGILLEGLRPLTGPLPLATELAGITVLLARQLAPDVWAHLVRGGVHPLLRVGDKPIQAELERFRTALISNPPPWLAKLMGLPAEQRRRFRHWDVAPERRLKLVRA